MRFSLFLVTIATLAGFVAVASTGCVHYTNLPNVLPPNVPSLGYEANSLYQIGNDIKFNPLGWTAVSKVDVVMSAWTPHSEWTNYTCSLGYEHPISLQIFDVNSTLLYSKTQTFTIPWRPEPSVGCTSGRWMDVYGGCWSGLAFVISFDVSDSPTLPQEIVYAITFNTENYGFDPIGEPGPYDSLNLGLTLSTPSVGENVLPGYAFVNSSSSSTYGDGGAVNVFRPIELGYTPLISFSDCECSWSEYPIPKQRKTIIVMDA